MLLLRAVVLIAAAVLAAGCDLPRDTRETLERVQGGTLRVGLTEAEPWVVTGDGRPQGVEVQLIDGFARSLGADVDFTTGSEAELIGALHEGSLDLVAGGMTMKSPWSKQASPTRPFAITRLVVGLPAPGADSEVVAAEGGTEAAGLADRMLDARVEPVDRLPAGRPAVLDDWLLDDLGLRASEEILERKHVMFVRMGANAFQVALERYLYANRDMVRRLLDEQGRP